METQPPKAEAAPEPAPAAGPYGLRQIRGIVPKAAGLLQEAGVTTFAGAGRTDVDNCVISWRKPAHATG